MKLKEEYKEKIEVLLGVESDFFPEHAKIYQSHYKKYPFDYIIGSVHQVDEISIFHKTRWEGLSQKEKQHTKETYYQLIEESARSRMFQILGHIDAMKGFYPSFSSIETAVIDQTLKVISSHDIAIEVNTSGKTKDCGGWYPADDILERALHYGVHITFGSDAHDPERIGDDFELVKKRLKEIGFTDWVFFRQKKMQLASL